ncbi:hypothetical protein BVRB_030810, partial [Beta vulgaris subsp. vulgaris]
IGSLPFLEHVVRKTRVLVVNGEYDWVCNYIGIENLLDQYLMWDGKHEFVKSRKAWRHRENLGGYMRTGGNLTHLVVYDAGHMVPLDQPEISFDVMMKFTQSRK